MAMGLALREEEGRMTTAPDEGPHALRQLDTDPGKRIGQNFRGLASGMKAAFMEGAMGTYLSRLFHPSYPSVDLSGLSEEEREELHKVLTEDTSDTTPVADLVDKWTKDIRTAWWEQTRERFMGR